MLLTPGPHNETYFSTRISPHLGLPLVEGSDLTRARRLRLAENAVRPGACAILRRLDDDYCDPLELRSDSALGISGWSKRAARQRAGRQRLGSNLLESSTLLGYLPNIAQRSSANR